MRLTDHEKAMRDGAEGPARARAMDLLIRYGEALGAERLVDTDNVAGTMGSATPFMRPYARGAGGFDAIFSEFNLDSSEIVATPDFRAATCQLIHGIDKENARSFGIDDETVRIHEASERFFGQRGARMFASCTPYQLGNVPSFGEHCAWMESSAVVYCNGALGARTNTEGRESTGAASVTGKIPYWGLHIPENRRATHLVRVECPPGTMMDWGLLGYWLGGAIDDAIPVLDGVASQPDMPRLKHFGAAAASSGGVEMYHIPGVTPEAATVAEALRNRAPAAVLGYGAAERRAAYDALNISAGDEDLDFVMLGCPHDSIDQIAAAAHLLEGRRLHANTELWLFTPRAIAAEADRIGYTKTIEAAGGRVMSDTCPAISKVMPPGTRRAATDSAKQAHYLPAITGVSCRFGSIEHCIDSAVAGRWVGRLA